MDKFTESYIETALWSSIDDHSNPLDDNYGPEDFAEEAMKEILEDCKSFQEANWEDIVDNLERAGHDFWLTRNGHGAGFWDGDWPEEVGKRLTQKSKEFGGVDIVVGDDGKLYI